MAPVAKRAERLKAKRESIVNPNLNNNNSLIVDLQRIRGTLRNEKEPKTAEEIFTNLLLNEKQFMRGLQKYVENNIAASNKKNDDIADKSRKEGVIEYNKKDFNAAIICYNKSLTYISNSSKNKMAITYCYRGAAFFGLEMYDYCKCDLERAKSLGYPGGSKYVLDYNTACCLYKLGHLEEAEKCAKDGIEFLKNLKEQDKIEIQQSFECLMMYICKSKEPQEDENKAKELGALVEPDNKTEGEGIDQTLETEKAVEESDVERFKKIRSGETEKLPEQNSDIIADACKNLKNLNADSEKNDVLKITGKTRYTEGMIREVEFSSSFPKMERAVASNAETRSTFPKGRHETMKALSKVVEIKYDRKLEKYIACSTEVINKGDVIMEDEPYITGIRFEFTKAGYCLYCFVNTKMMFIPCPYCIEVSFCSEKCRDNAWKEFHHVECGHIEFIKETEEVGYMAMRMLTKAGLQMLDRPLPSIKNPNEIPNPDVSNPVEFCDFFYILQYEKFAERFNTEAALSAAFILHVLDQKLPLMLKVEDGTFKVGDDLPIKENDGRPIKENDGLKEEQKENLGRRLVRHWLQLQSGYVNCFGKDDVKLFSILPMWGFFPNSCDPNVMSSRFIEGNIMNCRASQKIEAGQPLSLSEYYSCYSMNYTDRTKLFRNKNQECKCVACIKEPTLSILAINVENIYKLIIIKKGYLMGLTFLCRIVEKGRDKCRRIYGARIFWKAHEYINEGIKIFHSSNRDENHNLKDIIKTAIESLQKLDLTKISLVELDVGCSTVINYVKNLINLPRNWSSFKTVEGQGLVGDTLALLRRFKDLFRSFFCNTFFEVKCISMMESGEKYLMALSKELEK